MLPGLSSTLPGLCAILVLCIDNMVHISPHVYNGCAADVEAACIVFCSGSDVVRAPLPYRRWHLEVCTCHAFFLRRFVHIVCVVMALLVVVRLVTSAVASAVVIPHISN